MPSKATVSGILMDATLSPIAKGKIIATLNGSDIFDGGIRVVTQKVEATTGPNGEWSLDLIVNGEGDAASTSWTLEGYNQFVSRVFEVKSLFIATGLPQTLGDLEKTSLQNLKAAREGAMSRLIIANHFSEYEALPPGQRRDSDIVLVRGA
ncbi:MAG TPA: hypothetical protein VNQ78_19930 [Paracoccus sp. (in: a-proteobacteria)]|uniref:hypothetical protein n=1 Tax=Paracoccus sp. TaxID=267 RepID=UPI002BAEE7EF|nr:hypothetical protein [Paracoccus sp. (in: a-proteobacteria)]HWL58928.1 hypothetical protein [Paracoccus sp. (in: a-proteobacteria)]